MKEILLLIAGASLTLVGALVKSWIDREAHCSNEIFKQRLSYLNKIWMAFYEVKSVYDNKLALGHSNWIKKHKDEAIEKLNVFRRCIDEGQVILSKDIISEFMELDLYLFKLLGEEDQKPTVYIAELNVVLGKLSNTINSNMNKRAHKIELRLNH